MNKTKHLSTQAVFIKKYIKDKLNVLVVIYLIMYSQILLNEEDI